jgi:hypothetical protein
MKKTHILLAVLLISLFPGCLLGGSERVYTTSVSPAEPPMISLDEKASGSSDSFDGDVVTGDRKLIRRASLQIEVQDFEESSDRVAAIAGDADGFVSGSNSYVTDTGRRRGTITIRVPESEFFTVIELLEGVGDVESKSVSSEDVSEEYVDLEARLGNLERQEGRLLEIFERAETVEDILKVEEQLGRVRGQIESLTGRLRFLENRVSLSTVSVELFEPEPITTSFGLRDSVRTSLEAFIATTSGIIVFIGLVLPIAIILGVLIILVRAFRKKNV